MEMEEEEEGGSRGGGVGDDGASGGVTPRPNVRRSRQPSNQLSSFGGGEEEDGVCVGVGGGGSDGDRVGDECDGLKWPYWTGLTTSSLSYFEIKEEDAQTNPTQQSN